MRLQALPGRRAGDPGAPLSGWPTADGAIILAPLSAGKPKDPIPKSQLFESTRRRAKTRTSSAYIPKSSIPNDTPYPTIHSSCQTSSLIQAVNRSIYLLPPRLTTRKHDWKRRRWWAPRAAPAHQLHLQASAAALDGSDLAVRAGVSWSLKTSQPATCVMKVELTRGVMVQLAIRIEGKIRGFDEFMNLVVSPKPEMRRIWVWLLTQRTD